MSRRPLLIRFRGERYTIAELSDMCGVPVGTITARLNDGWTVDQAILTPTPKQRGAGVVSNL